MYYFNQAKNTINDGANNMRSGLGHMSNEIVKNVNNGASEVKKVVENTVDNFNKGKLGYKLQSAAIGYFMIGGPMGALAKIAWDYSGLGEVVSKEVMKRSEQAWDQMVPNIPKGIYDNLPSRADIVKMQKYSYEIAKDAPVLGSAIRTNEIAIKFANGEEIKYDECKGLGKCLIKDTAVAITIATGGTAGPVAAGVASAVIIGGWDVADGSKELKEAALETAINGTISAVAPGYGGGLKKCVCGPGLKNVISEEFKIAMKENTTKIVAMRFGKNVATGIACSGLVWAYKNMPPEKYDELREQIPLILNKASAKSLDTKSRNQLLNSPRGKGLKKSGWTDEKIIETILIISQESRKEISLKEKDKRTKLSLEEQRKELYDTAFKNQERRTAERKKLKETFNEVENSYNNIVELKKGTPKSNYYYIRNAYGQYFAFIYANGRLGIFDTIIEDYNKYDFKFRIKFNSKDKERSKFKICTAGSRSFSVDKNGVKFPSESDSIGQYFGFRNEKNPKLFSLFSYGLNQTILISRNTENRKVENNMAIYLYTEKEINAMASRERDKENERLKIVNKKFKSFSKKLLKIDVVCSSQYDQKKNLVYIRTKDGDCLSFAKNVFGLKKIDYSKSQKWYFQSPKGSEGESVRIVHYESGLALTILNGMFEMKEFRNEGKNQSQLFKIRELEGELVLYSIFNNSQKIIKFTKDRAINIQLASLVDYSYEAQRYKQNRARPNWNVKGQVFQGDKPPHW